MRKIVKSVGKSVTVNISNVTKLLKFIKNITWDSSFFFDYIKKVSPGSVNKHWYIPTVFPHFIVLPDRRYTYTKLFLWEQAKIQAKAKIENIARFSVFEVVPDESEESSIVDTYMTLCIDYFKEMEKAYITTMGLEVCVRNRGYSTFPVVIEPRDDSDVKMMEEALQILMAMEREGKEMPTSEESDAIERFEDSMVAILNLLYTAYTGKYEKHEDAKILEPVTELLQNYGNTFEEVLTTIEELMTIVG